MLAVGRISHQLGLLSQNDLSRLKTVIQKAGLPTEIRQVNMGKIISAMKHDKKVARGKLRFVLPQAIGKAIITDEVSPGLVEKILAD